MPYQQGAILLITTVLLVVLSSVITAAMFLFVTQSQGQSDLLVSTQARYLAESGIEKGIHEWVNNPSTYTGEGPVDFGAGSFTVDVSSNDASGQPLSPGQARIIGTGTVTLGNATYQRQADMVLEFLDLNFMDSFDTIDDWTVEGPANENLELECAPKSDIINNGIQTELIGYSNENAPGSTGGSLGVKLQTPLDRVAGYRQRSLPTPIGKNNVIDVSFQYQKTKIKKNPVALMIAVELLSTDDIAYRLWSDCKTAKSNWRSEAFQWQVPSGKVIDRLRVVFHLYKDDNNFTVGANIDDIHLQAEGLSLFAQ